ncbi:hypothetical protein [Nonomuraea sp. NPDC049141]|uniref:hypothetical protein n=1 Tax=Nonomuraea sp. NPDC049141 TaxID=3155500 RepID=UPI00340F6791
MTVLRAQSESSLNIGQPPTEYKMLGLGMAVAILIDATVVRGVLLPAAMALLGERTWRRPAVLSR